LQQNIKLANNAIMASIAELRARLEKKATFEASMKQLCDLCDKGPSDRDWKELFPVVIRAHTLLKTRYSNPSFHRQGEKLCSACLVRWMAHRCSSWAGGGRILWPAG
jgi:hypothetical protein